MASIDKRPNGSWRARWRPYPAAAQQTRAFARKVDAEDFLDGVRGDLVRGAYVDPRLERQSFAVFADEWAAAQDWKDGTRRTWVIHRKRLVAILGDRPLGSIDLLTLQQTQQELGESLARSTTVVAMEYCRGIMRAAYGSGRIGRDPTRGLRAPKARSGDRARQVGPNQVPSVAEALAILDGAPGPYRAGIALGLAGLRIGEVLGLDVAHVELDRARVTVARQQQRVDGGVAFTTPKAEKTRTVIVPPIVAVELRRHLRDHACPDGMLFGCRAERFYRSGWRPALVAAGLEPDRFRFHGLRHFCASTLLAEGAPLTAVAAHLGDTVETVSRTYVHWLRDSPDVPAAVLDRVLHLTTIAKEQTPHDR